MIGAPILAPNPIEPPTEGVLFSGVVAGGGGISSTFSSFRTGGGEGYGEGSVSGTLDDALAERTITGVVAGGGSVSGAVEKSIEISGEVNAGPSIGPMQWTSSNQLNFTGTVAGGGAASGSITPSKFFEGTVAGGGAVGGSLLTQQFPLDRTLSQSDIDAIFATTIDGIPFKGIMALLAAALAGRIEPHANEMHVWAVDGSKIRIKSRRDGGNSRHVIELDVSEPE